MVKEYTKQVMHNAIVHHPLTDAKPDPKQQPLPSGPHFSFVQHDIIGYGMYHTAWNIPLGLGVTHPGCVPPPSFLCPPASSPVCKADKTLTYCTHWTAETLR